MAEKTAELHRELCRSGDSDDSKPELWLVGYSELKNKGIFTGYKDCLKECYSDGDFWDKVFVFQHFSMNRFTIDLNDFIKSTCENGNLKDFVPNGSTLLLGNLTNKNMKINAPLVIKA